MRRRECFSVFCRLGGRSHNTCIKSLEVRGRSFAWTSRRRAPRASRLLWTSRDVMGAPNTRKRRAQKKNLFQTARKGIWRLITCSAKRLTGTRLVPVPVHYNVVVATRACPVGGSACSRRFRCPLTDVDNNLQTRTSRSTRFMVHASIYNSWTLSPSPPPMVVEPLLPPLNRSSKHSLSDRPFPAYTPSGERMTPAWRYIRPELRGVRILSVGLQKTGSTSAGWALVHAGIRVSHNQGEQLSDVCQAAFTAALPYTTLRKLHPNAAWLITYVSNFTAWARSLRRYHQQTTGVLYKGLKYMPCHLYQCNLALTPEMELQRVNLSTLVPLDPATGWLFPKDMPLLETLWRTYYDRLFAHLDREVGKGRYAVADVRARRYTGFEHLQGLNVSTPFGVFNDNLNPLNRPGHSWSGKTTCCEVADPYGNPCPEDLMNQVKRWDWCPSKQRYQARPKRDSTRARMLSKCGSLLIDPRTGKPFAQRRNGSTTIGAINQEQDEAENDNNQTATNTTETVA